MDQAENRKLAEKSKALENASANLYSASVTEPGLRQLSELADQLALGSYTGRIGLAGQRSSGTFYVQFKVDGNGSYGSSWPGWAFELAKAALLSNKRVWVWSDGVPFGDNLVSVLLLPD